MKPAISLIITYYNQKDTLPIILDSICLSHFDLNLLEIVIINDGCNDELEIILKKYSSLRINYVKHSINKGRSTARNSGANVALGDLLIFIDGDRFVSNNFIAEHVRMHQKQRFSVVIGNIAEIFISDLSVFENNLKLFFTNATCTLWKSVRFYNYSECVFKIYDDNGFTNSDVPWITLFSGNFSIKKELYQQMAGFDEQFVGWGFENIDFGFRLHISQIPFVFNKKAVNFHLYHSYTRAVAGANNGDLLKSKYNNNDKIIDYFNFLNGKISLGRLISSDIDNLNRLFYNPRKFGSRYCQIK